MLTKDNFRNNRSLLICPNSLNFRKKIQEHSKTALALSLCHNLIKDGNTFIFHLTYFQEILNQWCQIIQFSKISNKKKNTYLHSWPLWHTWAHSVQQQSGPTNPQVLHSNMSWFICRVPVHVKEQVSLKQRTWRGEISESVPGGQIIDMKTSLLTKPSSREQATAASYILLAAG